jgi:hypothetical protein
MHLPLLSSLGVPFPYYNAWTAGFTGLPDVVQLDDGVTGFIVDDAEEAVLAIYCLDRLDHRQARARFEQQFTAKWMAKSILVIISLSSKPGCPHAPREQVAMLTQAGPFVVPGPTPSERRVRGKSRRLGLQSSTHSCSDPALVSRVRFSRHR